MICLRGWGWVVMTEWRWVGMVVVGTEPITWYSLVLLKFHKKSGLDYAALSSLVEWSAYVSRANDGRNTTTIGPPHRNVAQMCGQKNFKKQKNFQRYFKNAQQTTHKTRTKLPKRLQILIQRDYKTI